MQPGKLQGIHPLVGGPPQTPHRQGKQQPRPGLARGSPEQKQQGHELVVPVGGGPVHRGDRARGLGGVDPGTEQRVRTIRLIAGGSGNKLICQVNVAGQGGAVNAGFWPAMSHTSVEHAYLMLTRRVKLTERATYLDKGRFGVVFAAGGFAYKVGSRVYMAEELRLLRRMHRLRASRHLVPLLAWWQTPTTVILKLPLFETSGYVSTRRVGLAETHVPAMISGLAAGMIALHSLGILHLDPKPENTLVRNHHWAVSDYGNSAAGHELLTGRRHYTCMYRSPLAVYGIVNPATDIFALALTMWELATGYPLCHTQEGTSYRDMAAFLSPVDSALFRKTVARNRLEAVIPSTSRAGVPVPLSKLKCHYRQTMVDTMLNYTHSGACLFLDYWHSTGLKSRPPSPPPPPSPGSSGRAAQPPSSPGQTSPPPARAANAAPPDRTGADAQSSASPPRSAENHTK